MTIVSARPTAADPTNADARPLASGVALWLAVALGAGSMFLAPRPPMVDFGHHVGQVALWRDLLSGSSPFADFLRINLLTPYLIGYGLALPLSFVVAPAIALKLVLAAAFPAFVWSAQAIRRDLRLDPALDWLFLFGFFGHAWLWGFYTFLVAAPVTLVTLRQALRFDAGPTRAAGLKLFALAAVLLFCHGLQFVFVLLAMALIWLGRALSALRARVLAASLRELAVRAAPGFALAIFLVAFLLARRFAEPGDPTHGWSYGLPVLLRPTAAILYVWGVDLGRGAIFLALTVAAMAIPLTAGLRPRPGAPLAAFCAICLWLLAAPDTALDTGFLFQRFAAFLAPLWALTLAPAGVRMMSPRRELALAACAVAALGLHLWRVESFRREEAPFADILPAVEPGQRILNLPYDKASEATGLPYTYLHWGAWLQTRGAFVDFNIAFFHPQVVRFKAGRMPAVLEYEGWSQHEFDWDRWRAGDYDAFLVRGAETDRAEFLNRARCALHVAAQSENWTLYRKGACPAP